MKVLLFAQLRLAVGAESIELDVTQPIKGVEVWERLQQQYPALQEVKGPIRLAVDQQFVAWEYPVRDDQEIALIPPVSGG